MAANDMTLNMVLRGGGKASSNDYSTLLPQYGTGFAVAWCGVLVVVTLSQNLETSARSSGGRFQVRSPSGRNPPAADY